jgi:hypothetical protein
LAARFVKIPHDDVGKPRDAAQIRRAPSENARRPVLRTRIGQVLNIYFIARLLDGIGEKSAAEKKPRRNTVSVN